jgi:hypothetical protein
MRAIETAHKKIIAGRRLQDDNDAFLDSLGPLMCATLEGNDSELQDILDSSMEDVGLVCPMMGCDDPTAKVPNLTINCHMDAETCDEDPSSGEKFCVAGTDVEVVMALNFAGESKITSTQCCNYTSPAYLQDLDRGCFSFDMAVDYGAYMQDLMSGKLNINMDTAQDDIKEIMPNYFEFDKFKCSGEFGDGTTCKCGSCHEGKGFEFTCSNDLLSGECTDFDLGMTDGLMQQGGASEGTPSVSIMRLLPATTGEAADETANEDEEGSVAEKVVKEAAKLRGAKGDN